MSNRMHMVNSFDPSHAGGLSAPERVLLDRRQRSLGAPYRLFYRKPVHLVRGDGVLLYDAEGRDYLDAYNNVPVVGHSNRAVHDSVAAQLLTLNTHTRYLTDDVVDYAERLLDLFPPHLDQVVFTCTGSEAVDLALRVSRYVTGREGVIVTRHAYHGTTAATAEVSPSFGVHNVIGDRVVLVDAPDHLRDEAGTGAAAFAERVRDGIDELRRRGHEPAALLIDSVLSSDGLQSGPAGLLQPAARVMKAAGGLYIADEVQSGFGRTGGWWGFTRHALEPDLVVLGKPMGNGIPIAALVARSEILNEFGQEVRYFNTFGGNPVSIAAAGAVLDELTSRDLQASAASVGGLLAREIRDIAETDEGVGEVRQAGLFLAVELVKDARHSPDPHRAAAIVDRMRESRVLISASGTYDNVLKVRPPLAFAEENAPRLLDALGEALTSTAV